ncbi:MAG: SurA N-terminal domain-containing protein [Pseudomonadota bacterium]
MLQNMRDNSKGVISGILVGLLVIIFAISGAEALFQTDVSANKTVTVNGDVISETDVARAIANRKQQIISRYGESVPAEFLTDEKLRQPSIDGLIQRTLISQSAKKGGLAIGVDSLNKEIVATPAFQKEGGVFDQEKFVTLLSYQGFTPATYQKAIAEDQIISQFQSGIVNTAFVTPAELKTIVGLSFQTRDFNYVIISAADAEKNITVDDADIKANYEANPQAYTTPERVAVDYVELGVSELMKNIAVTDEQARKQFEQNSKSFVAKTERQAAHILLEGDAKKNADEIKAKLVKGEDFAKLAKEYSTDAGSKEQGGDLGFSSGDAFPSEFEAALAKLKVGETSAPVKTDAGIHIIKLLAERGAQPPSFEEAKPAIIEQLKQAEADNQFSVKLKKLGELSYNADKLADVANELGLVVKNSDLFAKTGGKDLMANNLFINAAFSPEVLEQGNASEVIELEPTRVVVLKKTDRKPSQLEPLDSVKEKIAAIVRTEKTQAFLAQQAKDFISAVNSGKAMADQAKSLGLTVKTVSAVGRNDQEADRDALQFAFTMANPAPGKANVGSVKTTKGDVAVVALTAVNLAGEDKVPVEQKTSIAAQLANINGEFDMKSVQSHLEEVAKIKHK